MFASVPQLPVREPTNLLHFTDREFILFTFWKSGTPLGLFGSMVIVFLIGVLYEAVTGLRVFVARENDLKMDDGVGSAQHFCQMSTQTDDVSSGVIRCVLRAITLQRCVLTFLYGVERLIFFVIILIVVSFNVWLLISVVLGKMLGYFVFSGAPLVGSSSCQFPGGQASSSDVERGIPCDSRRRH